MAPTSTREGLVSDHLRTVDLSTHARSTTHDRNRRDHFKVCVISRIRRRTPCATERDVEYEHRAAASPDHRRFGGSEPGVISWPASQGATGVLTARLGAVRIAQLDGTSDPSLRATFAAAAGCHTTYATIRLDQKRKMCVLSKVQSNQTRSTAPTTAELLVKSQSSAVNVLSDET